MHRCWAESGHSLFQLHRYGIDDNNKIINSKSFDPFLTVSESRNKIFSKRNNSFKFNW